MATKIQLRRDLSSNWASTNPILAQGEPGVELDTNNMKVGDGVKNWNDLDYTVQAGGLQPAFFAITDYYSNISSVSEDGIHWTSAVTTGSPGIQHSNDFEVNGAVIGNGVIVYRCYNNLSNKDELRYGSSPYQTAIVPNSDVTRVGPNGEEITWNTLTFGGGYFVAGGWYYDSERNNFRYPISAYSADGATWTKINIDLDYVKDIVDAQNTAYNNTAGGMTIRNITYGTNGWLFSLSYESDSTNGSNRLNPGAFYITNIATNLNAGSYFASMPASDEALSFDGHGWIVYYSMESIFINTHSDPRQGTWNNLDMTGVMSNLDIANTDYYGVNSIVAGEMDGVNYMAISDYYGVVYYTGDQGTTWDYVTPGPAYAGIYELKNEVNGGIKFSDNSNSNIIWGDPPEGNWNGEKITIIGSYVVEMTGTWFLDDYSGNSWKLYHDSEKNSPVDTSAFGSYNIVSKYVNEGFKGDNSLILPDVTDIVVGQRIYGIDAVLTAEDRSNDFPEPNLVTSVDSDANKITLKYPLYQDFNGETLYFQAVVKYTHGDEIRNLVYGAGKFIAFGNDTARSYFTTNMTNWNYTVYGNPYNGTVIYGALDINKNSMRTDSQTVPGFTNSLQLGDTFNVSVVALTDHYNNGEYYMGGDYYGKTQVNSGNIIINPTDSTWYFGVDDQDRGTVAIYSYGAYVSSNLGFQDPFGPHDHNSQSGFDYYQHSHSISIETWNHNFYFDDYYGTFIASNIAIGNSNSYYDYYDYNHIDDIFFDGNDIFTSEGQNINIYTWNDGNINGIYIHWDDNAKIAVDNYGVTITDGGYDWQFTSDGDGVLYAPSSSDIDIGGYWTIGQGNSGVGYPYIGAVNNLNTPQSDAYDFVIQAGQSSGSTVNNYWYFNRDGSLQLPPSGEIHVLDFWAIGSGNVSVSATDVISAGNALDLEIKASSQYWYFQQDGKFKLPAGGDVVDSTGVSVLNAYRSLPQNAQSSNYTLTLNDLGKHIYLTSGNVSIPDDYSNNFSVGSTITVVTDGQDGSYIIPLSGVTLYQAGVSNAVTDIELPKHAWSSVLKLDANVWIAKL